MTSESVIDEYFVSFDKVRYESASVSQAFDENDSNFDVTSQSFDVFDDVSTSQSAMTSRNIRYRPGRSTIFESVRDKTYRSVTSPQTD